MSRRAPGRSARRLSTPPNERRRSARSAPGPAPEDSGTTSVEQLARRAAADARAATTSAIELAATEQNHRELFEPDAYRAVPLPRSSSLGAVAYRGVSLAGLPVESARFGVALCTDVLDRVVEPRGVLGELNRALEPDGRLYLTSPLVVGRQRSGAGPGPTRLGLNYLLETTGFALDDLQAVRDSADYAIVARKARPSTYGGFTPRR